MTEAPAGRVTIGVQIFEEVEALVASEGLSRSAAFMRISERTGRQAGTVSANYYRIARQRGATLQPRVRRGPGPVARGRGRRGTQGGEVASALAQVTEALSALQSAVRRQEQEITRLREENARFDEIRRLARRVS